METLLREWDGETVVVRYDRPSGAWIFLAVHSTRLGPAVGGTRMTSYPDVQAALRDALRLSEGMTFKFAASEMRFGGAKAVIAIPSDLDRQSHAALLQRNGALVKQMGDNSAPVRTRHYPGRHGSSPGLALLTSCHAPSGLGELAIRVPSQRAAYLAVSTLFVGNFSARNQ